MFSRNRIYILGALIFLVTAIFSKGYHHFDEHFQILEFASLKLNLNTTDNMPWEYFTKMRSAIQPLLIVGLYKMFAVAGEPNPFLLATITRIFSAALSFIAILFFIKKFGNEIQNEKLKSLLPYFFFLLWFIVYDSVRFSSENWSGNFFLLGLCFAVNKKEVALKNYLLSGLLFGFAFLFRFQSAFLIAGFVLWLIAVKRGRIFYIAALLGAISVALFIGLLMDYWFYGEWTFTAWNYFDQNILQHKAANFGTAPWWFYGEEIFLNAIPPFSLVYVLAFILFFIFYPRHVLTFALIPFLLAHSITEHKELRFLFPIVSFLPFVMLMAADTLNRKYNLSNSALKFSKLFLVLFWVVNIPLLIIIMFRPADNLIPLYEKVYDFNSPVTVYYINENPYHRVLDIHFYKRENAEAVKAESISSVQNRGGTKTLLALTSNEIPDHTKWKLVYMGVPIWLKDFNFNGWIDRTKFWRLYEMKERTIASPTFLQKHFYPK